MGGGRRFAGMTVARSEDGVVTPLGPAKALIVCDKDHRQQLRFVGRPAQTGQRGPCAPTLGTRSTFKGVLGSLVRLTGPDHHDGRTGPILRLRWTAHLPPGAAGEQVEGTGSFPSPDAHDLAGNRWRTQNGSLSCRLRPGCSPSRANTPARAAAVAALST